MSTTIAAPAVSLVDVPSAAVALQQGKITKEQFIHFASSRTTDCRRAAMEAGVTVDFLVMVDGKLVGVPTVKDAANDNAGWERHWARLQTDEFSFYEVVTARFEDDPEYVTCARHFWIFDAFTDIIRRRQDGTGDSIRKRKGNAVALAGGKAVSP